MIRSKMGIVTIEGDKAELLADFTCIARAFFNDIHDVTTDEVEEAIENAKHPEKIVREDMREAFKEVLKDLLKEVEEDGKKTC